MSNRNVQPESDTVPLPGAWANWKAGTTPQPVDEDPPKTADAQSPHRILLDYQFTPKEGVPRIDQFPATDDGRAAFFFAHAGLLVRFCPELQAWFIWCGHRWYEDTAGTIGHWFQILCRHELAEAAKLLTQGSEKIEEEIRNSVEGSKAEQRKASKTRRSDLEKAFTGLHKAANPLGNEKSIQAAMAALSRNPKVITRLQEWNADPYLVGTLNGTLDLRTGEHREGRPGDYINRSLHTAFDGTATCPNWIKFITRILPAPGLVEYVNRVLGYTLTALTDDQSFYFCFGLGNNGKSICINTHAGLMGDYARKAASELLQEPRNGSGCKANLAQLPNVRFLHGTETREGGRLREDVIKDLVAGDTLVGEQKYCDPFDFQSCAKLFFSGNERPVIDGTTPGIWRRVKLIPFTTVISEEERIPMAELMATLAAERAGILNWLVAGWKSIPPGGIPVPAVVKEAIAEYRNDEDVLGAFIGDAIQPAAEDYKEPKQDVFNAYRRWSEQCGIRNPWNMNQFTRRLKAREGWHLDGRGKAWVGWSITTEFKTAS